MPIKTLLLDFDGTCTDVPAIHQKFLDASFEYLAQKGWLTDEITWNEALAAVTATSPEAGWTLGHTPSAPAAADPYILAGEAALYIAHLKKEKLPADFNAYGYAYAKAVAPFRPELLAVLQRAAALGIEIHFISNSGTAKIEGRMKDLLRDHPALDESIGKRGDAEKYVITDLPWDDATITPAVQKAFAKVPVVSPEPSALRRPIYLRRGLYMRQIAAAWEGDPTRAATTLVCGDIWELDLALPAALGCAVHLIERGAPYNTYDYERAATRAADGTISADLTGLLARLEAP
jgi:phosphoglycolate phosphatase-like HAD superfamily hydrolase